MQFLFDNDRPIYIQLVEQLKIYIVSGQLKPGERLPSVRELALLSEVNPNTMQKALQELETAKLIYTERTNGKFVTTDQQLILTIKKDFAQRKISAFIKDMRQLGIETDQSIEYLKEFKGED